MTGAVLKTEKRHARSMFVTRCVEKYETKISLHCSEPNPPKNQNKTKNKTKRNHCFVLR